MMKMRRRVMNHVEVERLQRALNRFIDRHPRLGLTHLMVDGREGSLTKKMLHDVKYLIGYLSENNQGHAPDTNFYHRVVDFGHVRPKWGLSKEAVRRGARRRRRRRLWVRRNRLHAVLKPGVGTFDGKPVAKCVVPVLHWCRGHGWHGRLVSGYRTPAYSEHLCIVMCGRPQCPGRCAGRATNHAYATPGCFAVDVSDYVNFGHIVRNCPIQPHIHNSLPNDR